MLWISAALFCRVLYAGCNVLDSHYRQWFGNGYSQSFFAALFGLPFLLVLFVAIRPGIPEPQLWPWIALSGVFGSIYLVPYFAALRGADTSVIAALFALGRIFTPMLGAAFLAEHLAPVEIAGFLITVAGAVYLSYQPGATRFDARSLLLMALAGLLIALGVVTSKLVFNGMATPDGLAWMTLFSELASLAYAAVPSWRRTILADARHFRQFYKGYFVSSSLGLAASVFSYLSISLTKTSYAVMIGQFQPFFVLVIMALAGNSRGLRALEDLSPRVVMQKLAAFAVITGGVAVTLWR